MQDKNGNKSDSLPTSYVIWLWFLATLGVAWMISDKLGYKWLESPTGLLLVVGLYGISNILRWLHPYGREFTYYELKFVGALCLIWVLLLFTTWIMV